MDNNCGELCRIQMIPMSEPQLLKTTPTGLSQSGQSDSLSLNGLWKHNMKQILANLSARVLSILSNIFNVKYNILQAIVNLVLFVVSVLWEPWANGKLDLTGAGNGIVTCDDGRVICFSISNCLASSSLVSSSGLHQWDSVKETIGPPPSWRPRWDPGVTVASPNQERIVWLELQCRDLSSSYWVTFWVYVLN